VTEPAAILVVDDDADICHNLSDILTDLGYRVDTAHDGPAAMESVRRRRYDVALVDLKMPGMDGVEVCREIRKLRASTVAIIVTAYASRDATTAAADAGVWQVLTKPVDLPYLLGLVRKAVDQPLVLVVDDDPDLCANLWDLLRERGYRVGLANDPARAGDQLAEARFHVVVIDMKLPGGDGAEVFDLVRRTNPQARTVMITGHAREMESRLERVLREGADAVCHKPFDVPKLLDLLAGLVKRNGTG
jgi:two-component system response regulator HydG